MRTAIAPAHPPTGDIDGEVVLSRPISAVAVEDLRLEIRSLIRRTRALFRAAERSVDLDLDQPALEVLGHVVTRQRAGRHDIAQSLEMDAALLSRTINELMQLGLMTTITDVRHPTGTVLVPTAMGCRVYGEGSDAATETLRAVLAGWSDEEVETLTRLLAKLNQAAAVATG